MSNEKALKFLREANLFSKDPKRKVGAIILEKDTLIQLSCGYNGLPRGLKETWNKDNMNKMLLFILQKLILV
tara:strand:+ start:5541 stop:5756 length:216 start_codon:yes stop_codon:yes gene_type:complete